MRSMRSMRSMRFEFVATVTKYYDIWASSHVATTVKPTSECHRVRRSRALNAGRLSWSRSRSRSRSWHGKSILAVVGEGCHVEVWLYKGIKLQVPHRGCCSCFAKTLAKTVTLQRWAPEDQQTTEIFKIGPTSCPQTHWAHHNV
jgi:hypothetical protein